MQIRDSRAKVLKSSGGATHLNKRDTSPLQVHTHANFLLANVDSGKGRTYEDVLASASNLFAFAGMRLVALTA